MINSDEVLYSIALMYYRDGMTQEEISKKTNLSRPMVSRALAKAQKVGIVEIKLHAPKTLEDASSKLKKNLDLEKVYIAPSGSLVDFAPSVLARELEGERKIGIGWGKTIYKTVQKMAQLNCDKDENKSIVPLVSSIGIKEPHYQVNLIVSLLADSIGGTPYFYNSSDPHLKDLKELWSDLEVEVMGLGVGTEDTKGEILGKFFSEEGILSLSWPGYDSISNNQFMKAKKRICMCDGVEKIDSIITAAKLGLFNILITDTKTADELNDRICKGI